jgi:hypothetical protein
MEQNQQIKKLKLNSKTLSILDDKVLQNVKGGRGFDASEASCTSGSCKNSCRKDEELPEDPTAA